MAAVERALASATSLIWNSDQGSHFTSAQYTSVLKAAGVQISIELTFQCTTGNTLRFKVSPMLAAAAETAPEAPTLPPASVEIVVSDALPKRRGGRRKAAVAPAA